jgi:hypothetical protein
VVVRQFDWMGSGKQLMMALYFNNAIAVVVEARRWLSPR